MLAEGSWFEPIEHLSSNPGTFGGIVSNPPYIRPGEMPSLQPEVVRHEPGEALQGGGMDGMADLTCIADDAACYLAPGVGVKTIFGDIFIYFIHTTFPNAGISWARNGR